ncbi:alpha/beta hydrolase [Methylobacterium nonmethylotrophicum]|uniref:Alpha/beta hydrolase n=1 Tax=Methylobacterium nonmethylotrophicum TaxID=1141884 RepID=A0A4Z0NS92_9HYPH|nr:alpha/beta hydrolase [Methylobacterium nonmethylotrophicum]TGD99420.1 alpha/beta hydrolase [Methylobacterium nonmethylotrophicum]
MSLDPHVRRFLDMMAIGAPGDPAHVAGRRESLRALAGLAASPAVATGIRSLSLPLPAGPRPARLYTPLDAPERGPGLVYFHGGGLVAGDLETHDAVCRRLAVAAGCRIVAVDYRLAPEHPFPAAIEDAVAAFLEVTARAGELGIARGRLAVGGDSAGGGLAARVCHELRGMGPAIAAQLLICPVLDLRCDTASHRDFAQGYFLDARTIAADIAACGVAGLVDSPRVSPLREPDLAGLPPARIHTAAFDMVRDDGAAYARRLERAGVPVEYACHEGMIHFFYALGRLVPRSQSILAEIGAGFGALLRGEPVPAPNSIPQPLPRRAS